VGQPTRGAREALRGEHMRRSSILSLTMLALATSVLWAQGPPGAAPRQHGKPNKIFKFPGMPASENIPEKVFIVSSRWNLTKEDALANALERARDQVEAYLREKKQSLEWVPKLAFVRDRLLTDLRKGEVEIQKKELPGEDGKGELEEFLIDQRFRAVEETMEVNQPEKETKKVWLKVVVNPETWKQIQKEIRLAEDRKRLKVTKSRMVFLVKLLAGIVALLVTAFGYIRLDEWSKGYYTKWLRLAAVGCVATVTVLLLTRLAYLFR
jgi:hypothetical protein